jgi:hypothetical protein
MAAATVAWKNGAPSSALLFGSVLTMMIISLFAILPPVNLAKRQESLTRTRDIII